MRRHFLSFFKAQGGAIAVEFAFVAPVFFMFLFGIIEGGIMFFGQAALMNSVQDAARQIRTGQAQTGGTNQMATSSPAIVPAGIAASHQPTAACERPRCET